MASHEVPDPSTSDRVHRAPHRRTFTATTEPLTVTPTFVSRADATPRALRPQDAGSAVDSSGHEVEQPDARPHDLALEGDPNLAFEHFDEYWRKVHGPKFAYDEPGSTSELVVRYDQVHRIAGGPSSAWPPPYTAMTDTAGRLLDDPAAHVPVHRRPRWDGLAYITYRTPGDVDTTLGQEKFAQRVIADERTVFRKVTRGLTREHIILPSRLRREPISLVRILQRRPEVSREDFQRSWLEDHAALVLSQPATHTYVRRYAQLHTIGTTMEDPDAAAMDVVEILGFASVNDVEDYLTSSDQHAITEHERSSAGEGGEFWTGVNYTVIDRLMPELATEAHDEGR
ncbi:EthD domain-containing protein [Streptomyces kunmingensis]|uniref:EthD domain-containing protein n=1 Tax=Streptomyces kunmingensis TaxID=68225 RepID=A0ABU6C2F7_9ACTN|nr:EthD domain-containing protein [Streptomyces kunmingensis]MEB3958738.1 EthD domain-containing protein [Streptomyces kunmingensis]